MKDFKHAALTDAILCCFYTVYNTLGYGFLEKVYENSLREELIARGYSAASQYPVEVVYKEKVVGQYYADLLVDDKVVVEIKAVNTLLLEHEAQLLNYLRGTGKHVGLLLNFGPQPQVRRKVYSEGNKQNADQI